jgi:hypothetical protein
LQLPWLKEEVLHIDILQANRIHHPKSRQCQSDSILNPFYVETWEFHFASCCVTGSFWSSEVVSSDYCCVDSLSYVRTLKSWTMYPTCWRFSAVVYSPCLSRGANLFNWRYRVDQRLNCFVSCHVAFGEARTESVHLALGVSVLGKSAL